MPVEPVWPDVFSNQLRVISSRSLRSAQARKRVPSLPSASLGHYAYAVICCKVKSRELRNWKSLCALFLNPQSEITSLCPMLFPVALNPQLAFHWTGQCGHFLQMELFCSYLDYYQQESTTSLSTPPFSYPHWHRVGGVFFLSSLRENHILCQNIFRISVKDAIHNCAVIEVGLHYS